VSGKVTATRMGLLRRKKRLALARRGHYLLKGKQDELLRRLMELLEEYLPARSSLDGRWQDLHASIEDAAAETDPAEAEVASWPPPSFATVKSGVRRILNLEVPERAIESLPDGFPYGVLQLSACMDDAVAGWKEFLVPALSVADMEDALTLLSDEIERTRRRVNALEFRLIPELEDEIRLITLKLAEAELGNLSRLMRVKEIVRAR
jgi:V/A-type H+-transporting ATPase subunit D